MPTIFKILAIIFFGLAILAAADAINNIVGFRQASAVDPSLPAAKFSSFAANVLFAWLYAGLYLAVGLGFWQRRKINFILILLVAALVGQWMNVGYPSGFIAALISLLMLAIPAGRAAFRN